MKQASKDFIASANHAIQDKMSTTIGGGIFSPEEIKHVVNDLKERDKLEDLLLEALVYVEDQLDDPVNKPGFVKKLATQIRNATKEKP